MIHLVPLEFSSTYELDRLRHLLEEQFGIKVQVFHLDAEPKIFFDSQRGQYYSSAILKYLSNTLPNSRDKILAVTRLDLFIPILTFVFGEAQLNGACAVVSSFRLDNTFYGLPPDPDRLSERLFKEAVHELGHTFGLVHCRDIQCVMRSSTYMEEIDLKSSDFCDQCSLELNRELK